jgi:hypothetical protein
MDEEPDGLDRVRRQWEHLRIARERAENERREREASGTCTTSSSLADVTVPLVFTWMQLSIDTP